MTSSLKVVIAVDSFKGSIDAPSAAAAFAAGWSRVRPSDQIDQLPMADGGEGTLGVVESATPGARRMPIVVTGPDGRATSTAWLLSPDGTATVEIAGTSGLPLMVSPDALRATSLGLGEALRAATLTPEVRRIVVGLGGSACTDGGAGALTALRGVAPPSDGVVCLVDVDAPLLGPLGAAQQFAPQKGADAQQVQLLEQRLTRWATSLPGDPMLPGSGAAGGTAYGLVNGWGAELAPGSRTLAQLIGLGDAIGAADLVVTGEGRFDAQSLQGKVVGHVLALARLWGTRALVVAGSAASGMDALELSQLAGSQAAAVAEPARWLEQAGRKAASDA